MNVSVVVPVYNSARSLPDLVRRVEPVLQAVADEYELLLVNDGSHDTSWAVIQELASRHRCIQAIDLMRNYGQHNALLCGLRAARHQTVVTLDDDLQYPPEEIPKLLTKLAEGHDVVYGTPERRQHRRLRVVAAWITRMALRSVMSSDVARQVSPFRALRTDLRRAFADYRSPFTSIDVLLTWATNRFAAVLVRHEPRETGSSTYTFAALVRHALNMLTGFSIVPLQIASLVGFVFTVFGIVALVYVIVRYVIAGGSVPGFPFLASIVAIFSGAQLFALGLIGEYLARMHFRIMDRPPYVVRGACATIPESGTVS